MMNDNDSQWGAVLEAIRGASPTSFKTNFLGSEARIDGDRLIVSLPDSANAEWVENRQSGVVKRIVKSAYGREFEIEFTQGAKPIYYAETDDDEYDSDDPDGDTEIEGIYRNQENAIIKPHQLEWAATQYFRKKWRPLLGPLLSELIRELRQRCHYKTKRNTFKTTNKSLASALGVSERTIIRALKRDENGEFVNKYLNEFIARKEVLYDHSGDKIRTVGTKYFIYLDEPLTPDDQAKLAK